MPRAFLKSAYFKPINHVLNYINYIDKQSPIFSLDGELSAAQAMDEVGQSPQSQYWSQIFSMTKEDCERLEIDREYYKNFIVAKKSEIAKAYNISPNNLQIFASFHDKDHHPHVHMVIFSTDKREGVIKVHNEADRDKILNKASTSLKSIFANEIFKGDTLEIKKMKGEQRTMMQEQLKKQIDKIVSPEYSTDKALLAKLNELSQELQTTSGKKVYGYLNSSMKEKVDDILKHIFSHDTVCTDLLSKYGESQKELVEVYVDSKKTLGNKMTDWQERFFSPKKGDDTSRHNLIIKAALNLNGASSKEKIVYFEEEHSTSTSQDNSLFTDNIDEALPHHEYTAEDETSSSSLSDVEAKEKNSAEYEAQRSFELLLRGRLTKEMAEAFPKKVNEDTINEDLLNFVEKSMQSSPSFREKMERLHSFYSDKYTFDEFLHAYLFEEFEEDAKPAIKRVFNYYHKYYRENGTFDLSKVENDKKIRALRFDLMKLVDTSFKNFANELLTNDGLSTELLDFDKELAEIAATEPKTVLKNGKEITLPLSYYQMKEPQKEFLSSLLKEIWKPEFDTIGGKLNESDTSKKNDLKESTFLLNLLVNHAITYEGNRNKSISSEPRILQELLYPEKEELKWQPREKSSDEKRLEIFLKDAAHEVILSAPQNFAEEFLFIQEKLNLEDENISYFGQTQEVQAVVNSCAHKICLAPKTQTILQELYKCYPQEEQPLSYDEFIQKISERSPNFYSGLHSLVLNYSAKASAEQPVDFTFSKKERQLSEKEIGVYVQYDKKVCELFTNAPDFFTPLMKKINDFALANEKPVEFSYYKQPQDTKNLLNTMVSDLIYSEKSILDAINEIGQYENSNAPVDDLVKRFASPIQGGNTQLHRLLLLHLEQQYKNEPVEAKFKERIPLVYREKSTAEKKIEFQINQTAHNFIRTQAAQFANSFLSLSTQIVIDDGKASYKNQTIPVQNEINAIVEKVLSSNDFSFLLNELYQENCLQGCTLSLGEFRQQIIANTPNFYNGLHSMLLDYISSATLENPVDFSLQGRQDYIYSQKKAFLVQFDKVLCESITMEIPEIRDIRRSIYENVSPKNSTPNFQYKELSLETREKIGNFLRNVLTYNQNIYNTFEQFRISECPNKSMELFIEDYVSLFTAKNTQLPNLLLHHLNQLDRGELVTPKYEERIQNQYKEKTQSALASNLVWNLAKSVATAMRSNQADTAKNKPRIKSKKKTHSYNRDDDRTMEY